MVGSEYGVSETSAGGDSSDAGGTAALSAAGLAFSSRPMSGATAHAMALLLTAGRGSFIVQVGTCEGGGWR